jgi:hypothetical protein
VRQSPEKMGSSDMMWHLDKRGNAEIMRSPGTRVNPDIMMTFDLTIRSDLIDKICPFSFFHYH